MNSSSDMPCVAERAGQVRRASRWLKPLTLLLWVGVAATSANAQTALADRPIFSTTSVPGNLVLALSVEFPTAVTAADRSTTYSTATQYLGYFDPLKCYEYTYNEGANGSYFSPVGAVTAPYGCSGYWSGNFLNWATMQAVDPFRWALTGGYRAVDTVTTTILEKAVAPSNQGDPNLNFPHKSLTSGVSLATPFAGNSFNMQVLRCGTRMLFSRSGTSFQSGTACPSATVWDGNVAGTLTTRVYSLDVRVKVCASAGLKEPNCVQYGNNYKPQGLIQRYASKIRYSAFGYLNDPTPVGGSPLRDGGVLRARMKFVGPTQPVPGSSPIANAVGATNGQITSAEWDASTGVFIGNPDTADAAASSEANSVITKSGVINYLNQFGLSAQAYKYFDPVSELYYAATRYLRNLGNVPEYSDLTKFNGGTSALADRTAMKDGFPVITNWTDPILYSCQKNFVLGIGDTNANQDKDVPGNASYRTNEPAMPSAVSSDVINVVAATNKVGVMEGIGSALGETNSYNAGNNSAYIAGMAYLFNTTDIRSDLKDTQAISTYWLDVLEASDYKGGVAGRNQFYLAAKYGGFTVPTGFSYATNTAAPVQSLWSTNGETIPVPSPAGGPRPDNYFVANQADKMVSGLESAFAKMSANSSPAFSTSFSLSLPQVASLGNSSFSSNYAPANWTGEITASELQFDTNGVPIVVVPERWKFSEVLAAQLNGTGWDTNRRIVSWNGTAGGGGGVAFRSSGTSMLDAVALAALDTSYKAGDDRVNFLNYLRGDRTNEGSAYRTRAKLVGDIVGSKARAVGPPSFPFSDANNPGYSTFKTTWASRRTVVYAGANDGMMHAINGALLTAATSSATLEADANAGKEMFAYVPRALFQGPNSTPSTDGLASLGNPAFVHHYMVNATPSVYDVDFARTPTAAGVAPTGSPTPYWRSILIGGLGKGGRSYYAIDVTDPVSMAGSETAAASKVLWEFSDAALGYTFGDPIVAKTRKYGWVVIFPSGYNNADGKGYFLFVHPRTGALLERVSTGVGTLAASAGLAHANAFVVDASDGTADSVYAGDLLGNLWRLDLTAATGAYPTPTKLAALTDASTSHNPQPVTSRPSIEVHPSTKKRFVMVGTGRLLDEADTTSTQGQTFYAIADGTNAQFSAAPPSPLTFPVGRAQLANNSNALTGVTFNPATQVGWYEDLGVDASTGVGWRVTTDSSTLSGSVAFAATLPTIVDGGCASSGASRVYARDFAFATTTVRASAGGVWTPTLFVSRDGNVTDLRYMSVGGKATLIAGTDIGPVSQVPTIPLMGLPIRRLNWRELQTVD